MLLDDIAAYLEDQSVGTVGTDIFMGTMPDTPDSCIALYEYAGEPPEQIGNIERPGLQVRVRDPSYSAGRAKIESVVNALAGLYEQVLSGHRYLYIRAQQSPEAMGRDQSGREEFVVNFIVIKERG